MTSDELSQYGELVYDEGIWVFYGYDRCTWASLKKLSPHRLTQVHGHHVINSQAGAPEADGHWTEKKQQALVIQTADCLPVFFKINNKVVALHIGWRGLMQKILTESLKKLSPACPQGPLYVGPHIQMKSFQLDPYNAEKLLAAHGFDLAAATHEGLVSLSPHKNQHYLIHLSGLLCHEARQLGFKNFQVSPIDTYLSPRHHSFRRQRLVQARNLSFVMKTR